MPPCLCNLGVFPALTALTVGDIQLYFEIPCEAKVQQPEPAATQTGGLPNQAPGAETDPAAAAEQAGRRGCVIAPSNLDLADPLRADDIPRLSRRSRPVPAAAAAAAGCRLENVCVKNLPTRGPLSAEL